MQCYTVIVISYYTTLCDTIQHYTTLYNAILYYFLARMDELPTDRKLNNLVQERSTIFRHPLTDA